MDGKLASLIFTGICALLAVLLLAGIIGPLTSGLLFAIALMILGILSGGFRKQTRKQE